MRTAPFAATSTSIAAAGCDQKDVRELIRLARCMDPRRLSDQSNYGESPNPIDTGRMRRVANSLPPANGTHVAEEAAAWASTRLPKVKNCVAQ